METNIVICGVGGQGVITAGKLISTAAMLSGRKVVMSEIHGLAQRGGSVSVDVRIGNVLGPIIGGGNADLIIAMEPMEGLRNMERASEDTVFLLNTQKMPPVSLGMQHREYPDLDSIVAEITAEHTAVVIDALPIAKSAGEARTVSTVMVGAASVMKNMQVSTDDFFNAIRQVFPPKLQESNMVAFRKGREYSMNALKEMRAPGA